MIAEAEKPTDKLASLDSLRGIAILGVLITHASAVTLQTGAMARLLDGTKIGVELFYLVSAFTIFMAVDRRSSEAHPTFNFYVRRFFRIAPMFYISLALNYARLRFSFVHGYRATALDYVLGVFFLFGCSPMLMLNLVVGGWSIGVETTFYAIVPLLRRWLRSLRGAVLAFVFCFVLLNLGDTLLARHYPDNLLLGVYFGVLWFPAQLAVFLLGIVLYYWWKLRRPFAPTAKTRRTSLMLGLFAVTAFIALHLASYWVLELPCDTLIAGAAMASVLIYPSRWVVNAVTRQLGKLSYSIYLLHIFVMEALPRISAMAFHRTDRLLGFPFGAFACFVCFLAVAGAVSVALAAVSWRWIEQPGIKLGRRIIARREQRHSSTRPLPPLRSKADTPDAQF